MPELVAVAHEGRVLSDGRGGLPAVTVRPGAGLASTLEQVGADITLGPTLQLGEDYLVVAGCRAVPVPEGAWVAPATLADQRVVGAVDRILAEHAGVDVPSLRPAWFRDGWYDRVEAWVDSSLEGVGRRRSGPMRVNRTWAISAVLQIPTDGGDVWFKAPCEHFRSEPAVHRVLAAHFPDLVPTLVAEDDELAFLLMEPMGGTDDEQAEGAGAALAAAWAAAQQASLPLRDELLGSGLAVRDAASVVAGYRQVLHDSAELALLSEDELAAARSSQDAVETAVHELWACGFPDSLSHGDLHLGNVAWDGRELRLFDWTDGCWTHPLLDAAHVTHFDSRKPPDVELYDAFVAAWRAACPDADVDRAARLAPLVDLVFQADTFDRIARATEPVSTYELSGATASMLRKIPELVAGL